MFSLTTRFARFSSTSMLAMLLGAALAAGSVACVAPTGNDELATESAATAAEKDESPAKANAEEPQAAAEDGGITAAPGAPSETHSGTGGGGANVPEPPHGAHEPVSAQ
jgi:hypothetical protein